MKLEVTNDGLALIRGEEITLDLETLKALNEQVDHAGKRGDIRTLVVIFSSVKDPSSSTWKAMLEGEEFAEWQKGMWRLQQTLSRLAFPLVVGLGSGNGWGVLLFALRAQTFFSVSASPFQLSLPHEKLLPPFPILPLLWERVGWRATTRALLFGDTSDLTRILSPHILPKELLRRYPVIHARHRVRTLRTEKRFSLLSLPWFRRFSRLFHRCGVSRDMRVERRTKSYIDWHIAWCRSRFSPMEYMEKERAVYTGEETLLALRHGEMVEEMSPQIDPPDTLERVLAVNSLPASRDLLDELAKRDIRIRLVEENLDLLTAFLQERGEVSTRITPSETVSGIARCEWLIIGEKEEHHLETLTGRTEDPRPISVLNVAQATQHYQKVSNHAPYTTGLRLIPPVAEIVIGSKTRKAVISFIQQALTSLGFIPIVVKDLHGGFIYRAAAQFANEGLYLLEEGAGIEEVDGAFLSHGLETAPFRMADRIGNDLLLTTAQEISRYKPYLIVPSDIYNVIVERGHMGVRTGSGFYLYRDGNRLRENRKILSYFGKVRTRAKGLDSEELFERILFVVVQDVLRALSEGVVDDPSALDVVLASMLQFPRFLGGPLRYCENLGWPYVESRLRKWSSEGGGPRYAPSSTLLHLIESKKSIFEVEL